MRSPTAKLRQCTCSAYFTRDVDLERHLSDHAEQQRIRERMIGDLQAEALKHEAHAEKEDESSSESDIDQESEGHGESEGTSGHSRHRRPSGALVCPSCPRSEPFATKQKLQRHHEQDTDCHEVCVFCHVTFKSVRKFKRHAERCVGVNNSKRKRAYMDETCKELTILSNTKLEKAMRECKKRSRDESEQAPNRGKSTRPNHRAPKRRRIRQQQADNALDVTNTLSSYTAPTGIDPHSVRLSEAPAAPANLHDWNQTRILSTEATDAVVSSLDFLGQYDPPLMRILNSAPIEPYTWAMNVYDGNPPGNDTAAYQLS